MNKKKNDKNQQNTDSDSKPSLPNCPSPESPPLDTNNPQSKINGPDSPREPTPKGIKDWIMIGATVAIAFATVFYAGVALYQLGVMSDTLKEMKGSSAQADKLIKQAVVQASSAKNTANATKDIASRTLRQAEETNRLAMQAKRSADISEKALNASWRPWVSVHLDIGGDIKFRTDGVHVPIAFKIKNVGSLPAVGTDIHVSPILTMGGDLIDKQKEICGASPQEIPPNKSSFGLTLFPNEEHAIMYDIVISQSQIDQSFAKLATDYSRPRKEIDSFINPFIVGCVKYRSTIGGNQYSTGYIEHVTKIEPEHPRAAYLINTNGGDIPSALLRLTPWLIYGGYTY